MPLKRADLHPECQHRWVYVGSTTICTPRVDHQACAGCRQFRNTTRDVASNLAEVWYTDYLATGPFDWEAFEARLRGPIIELAP